MAPIRVKWDPEILAAGFRPSSIFDEVANMTAPVNMTASPALNFTQGLETLVKEAMGRVADLVANTTTLPTTTSRPFTPVAPSWSTTTTTPDWTTTPTTIQRAVERVTLRPVVPVEYVSIFSLNDFLECDRCNRTPKVEFIT